MLFMEDMMNINFVVTTVDIDYVSCSQSWLPRLLAVCILCFFFLNSGFSELEEKLKTKSF